MIEQLYGQHHAELECRWQEVLTRCGYDAVLVHSGTPLVSFLDDFEYAFRPNPLFLYWLPLTHHPESVLRIQPGRKPVLSFYQPDDYWHLPPGDPASWWADHFDVRVVRDAHAWKETVGTDLPKRTAAAGDSPALDALAGSVDLNPEPLITGLHLERTRKTPYEIACMTEASHLGVQGHRAAETAFREGASELEIHQAYLAACQHTEANLPYHNIIALNQHGAVLHYQGRDETPPPESRSFLIDAGCTKHAYCSDITRTYSGKGGDFSDLVRAMDSVQQELVNGVGPGVDFRQLHIAAHHGIAGILAEAEIIAIDPEAAVETGLSSVFYPHGLGHFIGLQTHDVAGLIDDQGEPLPRPEGHPFLRLTRTLEAGNVLTVEPGLYFIEPLLKRWKEKNDPAAINWERIAELTPFGGVRIEDNVVVTEEGNHNLTREAFAAAA